MVATTQKAPSRRDEQGFTMIEMLVALVLATIVLSGTLALQVAMMQGERDTRHATGITRLGKADLEGFRTAHYDAITPGTQTNCYDALFVQLASCTEPTVRYRTTLVISGDSTAGYVANATVDLRKDGALAWETPIVLSLERAQ